MNDPKIIKIPATVASAQSRRLFIESPASCYAAGYGLRRHQSANDTAFNGRRAS